MKLVEEEDGWSELVEKRVVVGGRLSAQKDKSARHPHPSWEECCKHWSWHRPQHDGCYHLPLTVWSMLDLHRSASKSSANQALWCLLNLLSLTMLKSIEHICRALQELQRLSIWRWNLSEFGLQRLLHDNVEHNFWIDILNWRSWKRKILRLHKSCSTKKCDKVEVGTGIFMPKPSKSKHINRVWIASISEVEP